MEIESEIYWGNCTAMSDGLVPVTFEQVVAFLKKKQKKQETI